MTKWEYNVIVTYGLLNPDTEELFKDMGAKGWELVAYDFDNNVGIFKRPAGGFATAEELRKLSTQIAVRANA